VGHFVVLTHLAKDRATVVNLTSAATGEPISWDEFLTLWKGECLVLDYRYKSVVSLLLLTVATVTATAAQVWSLLRANRAVIGYPRTFGSGSGRN
jgi:hypothetical protein